MLRSLALALALSLSAIGCDAGLDEPADSDDLVNGITKREIRAGVIPSWPDIEAAFDVILADDPALLDDAPRLARALFDEVNRAGDAQRGTAKANDDRRCERMPVGPDLSCEEWIVALGDPELAFLAREASFRAINESRRAFPCGATLEPEFNDDKSDAYRHAAWNAFSIRYISRVKPMAVAVDFTTRLTTAHENFPVSEPENLRRREMDLSNNAAGRAVAVGNPDATLAELSTLLLALPVEFVEPGTPIALDASRLVYFKGRADYDVSMTGSFTNPDSGGPWSAVLNLTQCQDALRGGLEITRGEGFQRRGVTGTVTGTTLDLAISFPVPSSGGTPCRNMEAMLTGSPAALSGPWTASNCPQGGQFSLSASP